MANNDGFGQMLGMSIMGSVVSGVVGSQCGDDPPEPDWTAYKATVGTSLADAAISKHNIGRQKTKDIEAVKEEFQFKTDSLVGDYAGGIEELTQQGRQLQRKTGFAFHGGVKREIEAEKEAAIGKSSAAFRQTELARAREVTGLEKQADKDLRMIQRDINKMLSEYARTTEEAYSA